MPQLTPTSRARRPRGRALATLAAIAAMLGGSLALAPAANAAEAGDVAITAPSTVTAGDTVEVSIDASATSDLFAYDVTVSYDSTLLEFDADSSTFPDGGFDSVTEGTDEVTFTSTRLGTSPGLEAGQTLVSFSFTALTDGSADIAISSLTLVGSAGDTTLLSDVDSVTTTIDAVATTPTATPTASASASATATPTDDATDVSDSTDASSTDGDLAVTGSDATVWVVLGIIAFVALAAGAVLVLRRKAVKS
ncbi:cohesin domain-containing protein [Microbacterium sp. NPDC076911]|uniref:cohesin domain-containing protein n=1 Tax=Microbacterium sp. NPDC076911 TaxID=3154958 RepID=UPI00341AB28A